MMTTTKHAKRFASSSRYSMSQTALTQTPHPATWALPRSRMPEGAIAMIICSCNVLSDHDARLRLLRQAAECIVLALPGKTYVPTFSVRRRSRYSTSLAHPAARGSASRGQSRAKRNRIDPRSRPPRGKCLARDCGHTGWGTHDKRLAGISSPSRVRFRSGRLSRPEGHWGMPAAGVFIGKCRASSCWYLCWYRQQSTTKLVSNSKGYGSRQLSARGTTEKNNNNNNNLSQWFDSGFLRKTFAMH
ncbi:hypothetical protein CI1B_47090 [Bradyrhizobium ivorense]|uniref:Uncharacterized protein n=1 Tax=Bradyrhizobium ivorense TaxID=2511166 RepID=A0A508TF67_9BRAD|nr:hypothetical protein CI1B_47090 [Bradyrhizobium ivorense]